MIKKSYQKSPNDNPCNKGSKMKGGSGCICCLRCILYHASVGKAELRGRAIFRLCCRNSGAISWLSTESSEDGIFES
jgi:hypothetical protein